MCTRLGKGCALIRSDPGQYPPQRPEDWTRDLDWSKISSPSQHCYGTISIQIESDGACTVRGDTEGEVDCPYGGPRNGSVSL